MSNRADVKGGAVEGGAVDLGSVAPGRTAPGSAAPPTTGARALDALRDRLPGHTAVMDVADVFSLLGDPSRLRLLLALLEGELCVSDLALLTEHSESAVSHALKLLRAHRIVAVRREGRRAFYRLDDPHVRMLLDLAVSHAAHSEMEHPERGRAAGAAS